MRSPRPYPLLAAFAALALAMAGCRQPSLEEAAASEADPPPAAAIAPVRGNMTLDEKLRRLQGELQRLIDDDFDGDVEQRMQRAEAITDRLLENEPPVTWLATQYSSEARLRQLQALADRIMAQLKREGADRRIMREDVRLLIREVKLVRKELALPGGGVMPPTLDSLLRQAHTVAVPSASDGREERTGADEERGPPLLGVPLDTL